LQKNTSTGSGVEYNNESTTSLIKDDVNKNEPLIVDNIDLVAEEFKEKL